MLACFLHTDHKILSLSVLNLLLSCQALLTISIALDRSRSLTSLFCHFSLPSFFSRLYIILLQLLYVIRLLIHISAMCILCISPQSSINRVKKLPHHTSPHDHTHSGATCTHIYSRWQPTELSIRIITALFARCSLNYLESGVRLFGWLLFHFFRC